MDIFDKRTGDFAMSAFALQEAMSDLLARIAIRSDTCGGRPCIRGLRMRVSDVLGMLAAGESSFRPFWRAGSGIRSWTPCMSAILV